MKTTVPLILASGSPRRQRLLREMGFEFGIELRPVEEIFPEGLSPAAVAEWVAREKANAYPDLAKEALIITADTIVALDNILLAKPATREEAIEMIRSQSGRTHDVITGVCLFHGETMRCFHETTRVTFRKLEEEEIAWYVDQCKPYDKAGAYGIQEWIGMIGIERIEGDFYNVVGLPLQRLYLELKKWVGAGLS